jgi:hypothetical protein
MDQEAQAKLPTPTTRTTATVAAYEGLRDFETFILDVIDSAGLPTDGILVSIREREKLLKNVGDALDNLEDQQRARASYIAKMIIAGSVGLFDAALNYLWDETISELRARVASFDLAYFFDLAEPSPARRKELSTADDLRKIDDAKLMEAANRIGLISDVGYHQLDHIRYMRNYASAAHPNQVDLTGLQLAEWLETCIREVITLPRDTTVAEIGTLLRNVKSTRLSTQELRNAAGFFDRMPPERSDNLAAGLFGLYTAPDTEPHARDNIRALWSDLWPYVSEDARNELGTKLGRFTASAEQDRARRARELLDLVDGAAYLPEPVRQAEIDQALDELLDVHNGWDNFYHEPRIARQLQELVGKYGNVPTALARKYVHHLVFVFLTNGDGVAWNAEPIYRELISLFEVSQASLALRAFTSTTISSRLQQTLARQKWAELLELIAPKLTGRRDRALLETVRNFNGTPDQLVKDSNIKKQLDQ